MTHARKPADPLVAVRKAADQVAAYIAHRDACIRVAHQHGKSLREIAEAADLSHQTVKNILDRA